MLGGADPPRRPPSRNPLIRSKSCNAPIPPRRKRGREVLEDITWIVNHHHSPSSWAGDVNGVNDAQDTGRRELIEDGVQPAGPSTARVLLDPSTANSVRRDMEERLQQRQQEDDISNSNNRLNATNMARIRSDTSLVSNYDSNSTTRAAPPLLHGSTAATLLLSAPTPGSFSRITTSALDSSSPPSSPHQLHYNGRYGQYGNNAGGSSSNAGSGLGRRATLPVIPTNSGGFLSSSSASNANGTVNSGIARPLSPSLRAPPPLRRSSSNSSLSSRNNHMSLQQQRSSPSTSSSPLMSPWMASTPVVPTTTGLGSREMTRAYTAPSLFATPSRSRAETHVHVQAQARQMPVPVIQREMPSPERKRTRRRGRVLDEEEDEEDDDDDDDGDDGDTEDES